MRVEHLESRQLLAGDVPLISEFMASNASGLLDQFGDDSDWIELHNPTAATMSLDGWFLTDDADELDKWRIPAVTIDPNDYLVVFASGRDIADPGAPLHTSFRLSADGEYLGLVRPDMTVAHSFAPSFPTQFSDISYGLPTTAVMLVEEDAPFSYRIPTAGDAALGTSWAAPGFDDSAWIHTNDVPATAGIGYGLGDSGAEFAGLIGTDVQSGMFLTNASLWARQEFRIDDPTAVDALLLRMQYDDGFAAFLNGVKVAEANAPEALAWNSAATAEQENADAVVFETFDVSNHIHVLTAGTNVLAIQGLNSRAFDQDLLIRPELVMLQTSTPDDTTPAYLVQPTPGEANRQSRGGLVEFSQTGTTFTEPITITLSTGDPAAIVRYTLDGSLPTPSSPKYSQPIEITVSTEIRVASMLPDGALGPVTGESFVHLGEDVRGFTSNLPIVVLENFDGRRASAARMQPYSFSIIEPDDTTGKADLTGSPDVHTRLGLKVRGQSSSGFPKRQYRIEVWNQQDQDTPMSLLGMSADSDWVLIAPWSDKALIRNTFAYDLGQQVGLLAPHTRHIEVFLNEDGGSLESGDYVGVYALVESIKVGENRVDITPLTEADVAEPEITGGYLIRFENEVSVARDRISSINHLELVQAEDYNQAQRDWIGNHIDAIDAVIKGPNFADPEEGYAKYIDVESFINMMVINELTRDQDSYVRSNFLYKPRGGKLIEGPLWDYNLIADVGCCFDNRNPVGWQLDQGYSSGLHGWFNRLLEDPDFSQGFIDRYQQLRPDLLSTSGLQALVDAHADPLTEAALRNFERWDILGTASPGFPAPVTDTWEEQIDIMQNWLAERTDWIDAQFRQPPRLIQARGENPGEIIVTFEPATTGSIYYTLDGTDPRATGGTAGGQLYDGGSLVITEPTQITARTFDPLFAAPTRTDVQHVQWSGPTKTTITVDAGVLPGEIVITEINYHPHAAASQFGDAEVDADEFEFIELMNVSSQPIDLSGIQLMESRGSRSNPGVAFTFSSQTLNPQERMVVVENREAFQSRYGSRIRIAQGNNGEGGENGQYGGKLANSGDRIELVDANGQTIQLFTFSASGQWPGRAAGQGSSLEVVDVAGDFTDPRNWRGSSEFGGSPGAAGVPTDALLVINEVLSDTDSQQGDVIELYNPTTTPIDVTNWFVSDTEDDFFKSRITTSTVVPPRGYAVLTEQQLGFGLDAARGGTVTLVVADADGKPLRFESHAKFGPSAPGVSLGRWPDGDGEFFPMAELTLGSQNTAVRPGDVVISEVDYGPLDRDGAGRRRPDDFEFIELYNQTDQDIDLGGWFLSGGIEFTFDPGTTIDAGQTLLLVTFNPDSGSNALVFRFAHNFSDSVPMVGRFRPKLEDTGTHLRLQRPGDAPADDPSFIPLFWVDEVNFTSESPWPTGLVGTGDSLTRASSEALGLLPTSWIGRASSPGRVEFISREAGDANDDGRFDQQDIQQVLQSGKFLTGQPAMWSEGDWTGDGLFDIRDIVAALETGTYLPQADAIFAEIR